MTHKVSDTTTALIASNILWCSEPTTQVELSLEPFTRGSSRKEKCLVQRRSYLGDAM